MLDRKERISGWRAKDASIVVPIGSGASAAPPMIPLFSLPGLPSGGPDAAQPSNGSPSSSKEVEPSPVDTSMSSTTTPLSWKRSSLA